MKFTYKQIAPQKWGIYSNQGLLATVSSQEICETVLANLLNDRRDLPPSDVNGLYKLPKLKNRHRHKALPSSEQHRSSSQALPPAATDSLEVSLPQQAAADQSKLARNKPSRSKSPRSKSPRSKSSRSKPTASPTLVSAASTSRQVISHSGLQAAQEVGIPMGGSNSLQLDRIRVSDLEKAVLAAQQNH